jgi:molybdenum cofactor guanylyltransferase
VTPEPPRRFVGAVLAGGSSSRMGRDKALIELAGEPLVLRVARALGAAGAERVFVVGGDLPRIRALGLDAVADRYPGEGPLGGVLTAMAESDATVLAVLATDLIAADPGAIRAVVHALAGHDVAVPVADGRRHFHHAVWHRSAHTTLEDVFRAGERAIKRAVHTLAVAEVEGISPAALADADTPDELPTSPSTARRPAASTIEHEPEPP